MKSRPASTEKTVSPSLTLAEKNSKESFSKGRQLAQARHGSVHGFNSYYTFLLFIYFLTIAFNVVGSSWDNKKYI